MKKMIQLLTIISIMILGINGVKALDIGTFVGSCNKPPHLMYGCYYQCEVDDGGTHYIKFRFNVEDQGVRGTLYSTADIETDGDCDFFGKAPQCGSHTFDLEIKEYPDSKEFETVCPTIIPKIHLYTTVSWGTWMNKNDLYVSLDQTDTKPEEPEEIISSIDNSCGFLGGKSSKVVLFLQKIFKYIKIIIPVLIVVLSIADFIKVIGTGKDDDMKKAINRFVKRIIIAIAFVLIPFLISLIINISGVTSEYSGINDGLKAVFCILE